MLFDSRIATGVALGYAVLLGACSQHEHDGDGGGMGQVESAVTCSAADLVKPAGAACDGPWQYRLYVHQCTVQCTRPRECRHPCFGESPARETRSAGFGESGTCNFYRDGCHGDGPPYCWFFDSQVPNPPSIYDQALGWINAQILDCGPYQYGPVRDRVRTSMRFTCDGGCPVMGGGPTSPYSESCSVAFNEFPVWNLGRDASLCGGTEQYPCDGYDTQCGPENPPLYSPPNRSLAQVRALVPAGRALYEQPGEPFCLTRDFMPVSTPAEVTQKYTKLKETWDQNEGTGYPGVDRAALRNQLAGNFKLLYETKYADLSDAARTFIRSLYTDYAGLRRECRDDPYQPPVTDPTRCGTAVAPIDNALGMCTELMAAHVSDAAFFVPDVCMSVVRDIARLAPGIDGCRQEDYLSGYAATIAPMLKRKVGMLATEPDGSNPPIFTKASLQQQLALINRLYWHIRQGLYSDRLPDAWVWQAFGEIWGGLWKTVTSRSLNVAGPPYTPDSTQKAIDIGLQTDVRVLEALLDDYHDAEPVGDRPPLKGALFLTALRDATRAMYERLRELGAYVDVACSYITPNCVEAGRTGPVPQLVRLMAATPTEADLTSALAAAGRVPAAWAGPQGIFRKFLAKHAHFRDAVEDALGQPYSPGLILDSPSSNYVPPARELFQVIQDANLRWNGYRDTGRFDPLAKTLLRFGVSQRAAVSVRDTVRDRLAALQVRVAEYRANYATYLSTLVSDIRNGRERASDNAKILQLTQQFVDTTEDLAKLRSNYVDDDARFANIANILNHAMSGEAARRLVMTRNPYDVAISAADARFQRGAPQAVPDFAVALGIDQGQGPQPFLRVNKGDVINIHVDGKWSPVCALESTTLPVPFQTGLRSTINVQTGPSGSLIATNTEGFVINWDLSQALSHGYTHRGDGDSPNGWFGCNQLRPVIPGPPLPPPEGIPWLRGIDIYTGHCDGQYSGGEEYRNQWDASFAGGLMLPDYTPLRAPVGALLVVELPRDATRVDQILNVRVVSYPNATLLVNQKDRTGQDVLEEDLYLVANDLRDREAVDTPPLRRNECRSPNTVNQLAVNIRRLQPMGTVIRRVGIAMQRVMDRFKEITATRIGTGRVLATDVAALTREAWLILDEECNRDPPEDRCPTRDSFPPELTNVFELLINKALAQMDRAVQMRAAERTLHSLAIDIAAAKDDLEQLTHEGRLLGLLASLNLRNLDSDRIHTEASDLVDVVLNDLVPVVDLLFPGTRTSLRTDYLAALIDMDINKRLIGLQTGERGMLDIALDAITDIHQRFSAEEGRYQPLAEQRVLGLSFPKTDCPEGEECRLAPRMTPSQSWFPQADLLRSGAVWAALRQADQGEVLGGRNVPITIFPRDLYSRDGGFRLSCNQADPFVRGMAMFFYYWDHQRGIDLNNMGATSPTKTSQSLLFVDDRGVIDYTMGNQLWMLSDPCVLFSDDPAIAGSLAQQYGCIPRRDDRTGYGPGNGLSPFTTFHSNLRSFRIDVPAPNPTFDSDELIVVLDVDARPSLRPVEIPGVCP